MTIFDLPSDLLEEIISRIPLKDVRSVKFTCKTFYTLSESFKKLHMAKELASTREGETRMIVLSGFNLHLCTFVFNGVNFDPSVERNGKLTFLDDTDDKVKISQVIVCDGLLLCIFQEQNTRYAVLNPYLEQTRWIKARYSDRQFTFALGYEDNNKSCRSYKLLRFIDYYYDYFGPPENQFCWYEIYDFNSDSWTTLDVTPNWLIEVGEFGSNGVSLKGNTYFCATQRYPPEEERGEYRSDDHMICFDFTRESFGPLLPFPFFADINDSVSLSCVKEEKLAVLHMNMEDNEFRFDIWITTKIEAEEVSWRKFLTLDTNPLGGMWTPVLKRGSFFVDEEKKISMGFRRRKSRCKSSHRVNIIGEDGYLRDLDLGKPKTHEWFYCEPHLFPYVPSLVQLKQPERGQKKNLKSILETILEKNRYNQKRLGLATYLKLAKEEYDRRSKYP